ncbi:MAG: hypothetical protein SFV51_11325 [Bryobacteraceae bacterium]|nr:hypothetical protein [Bryobacteraceae bacterium]
MRRLIPLLLIAAMSAGARKFYDDDPLEREPKPRRVEQVKSRKLSDYYDLFSHQFGKVGEKQPKKGPPIRARAVNTLGEPLQGAWWEKRHYYRTMSNEELIRGPGDGNAPADGPWTVISAKTEGITPGFVMRDSRKRLYFVKFDPISNPEIATSADAITSRLFYALGYHVPQNYLVYFTEDRLVLGENVEVKDSRGRPRKMTRRDLVEIMIKVPRTADGKYRATASLGLPGRPAGPPRYYGTRADDPNDVVPHEHRRDQRGLHVFAAWTSHDDSRAINNLDTLVEENGLKYVKHFQLDFGSTLGSASSKVNSPRSGVYFFSWKESAISLFSLGLHVPYWAHAKYPDYPSVGRFEWKVFDPERWVPEYPNPAFLNRLPDDEFWAAKQAMAISDDNLRALVSTGQLTDKAAEKWLTECLIERRNKIGRAYFRKLLPLDQFAIVNGRLEWVDLSEKHGFGGAGPVSVEWSAFDNETEKRTPIEGAASASLPPMNGDGYWVAGLTSTKIPSHKISVYLRKRGGVPQIVGIDRQW